MCESVAFEYNGEKYSAKDLKRIIDYYNKMQFKGGDMYCPLCNSELAENNCFVCEECKTLLPMDSKCSEHYGYKDVCLSCCHECEIDRVLERNFEQTRDLADRGM